MFRLVSKPHVIREYTAVACSNVMLIIFGHINCGLKGMFVGGWGVGEGSILFRMVDVLMGSVQTFSPSMIPLGAIVIAGKIIKKFFVNKGNCWWKILELLRKLD